MLKKSIARLFGWGGVISLLVSASNAFSWEYDIHNGSGRPLWLKLSTGKSGSPIGYPWLEPGQVHRFKPGGAWCLTGISYDAGGPRDTKKGKTNDPKNWTGIKFSIGNDLKKITAGATVPAGLLGMAGGAVGTAIIAGGVFDVGGGVASIAGASALTIGTMAGAALGIAITGGAIVLATICRNIKDEAGIYVYENNKGELRWTIGKKG